MNLKQANILYNILRFPLILINIPLNIIIFVLEKTKVFILYISNKYAQLLIKQLNKKKYETNRTYKFNVRRN